MQASLRTPSSSLLESAVDAAAGRAGQEGEREGAGVCNGSPGRHRGEAAGVAGGPPPGTGEGVCWQDQGGALTRELGTLDLGYPSLLFVSPGSHLTQQTNLVRLGEEAGRLRGTISRQEAELASQRAACQSAREEHDAVVHELEAACKEAGGLQGDCGVGNVLLFWHLHRPALAIPGQWNIALPSTPSFRRAASGAGACPPRDEGGAVQAGGQRGPASLAKCAGVGAD